VKDFETVKKKNLIKNIFYQFIISILRKVYSLFFTFLCKNVSSEKTAPEPELALNPEPN
jgi:hypothetical protein